MLKRHEDALMSRIDEITCRGWTIIHWWEAYLWYDRERLGKKFWRDIQDRFAEDNPGVELYVYHFGDGPNGGVLFVHSDNLTTLSATLGKAKEDKEEAA